MHLRELEMVFEIRFEFFLQWLDGRAFLSVGIAYHSPRPVSGTTSVH